jgi:hypothetical protein
MSTYSTTRLAGLFGLERNELVTKLIEKELLVIDNRSWKLTEQGKKNGGELKDSPEGYSFIVWPVSINDVLGITHEESKQKSEYLTTKNIAKEFGITPQRLSLILAEIGWIKKHIKGWSVTNSGSQIGGVEREFTDNGTHYVTWPHEILSNRILCAVIDSMTEDFAQEDEVSKELNTEKRIRTFRTKNPGKYRTKDGHWVRSRAEIIIDDALYDYGIAHSYERRLPVEEEVYSDFYLPGQSVYIEFWGLENDPKYLERKKQKIAIYKKYNLSLIELSDEHLVTLDDHLPRFLLKYGIRVY